MDKTTDISNMKYTSRRLSDVDARILDENPHLKEMCERRAEQEQQQSTAPTDANMPSKEL